MTTGLEQDKTDTKAVARWDVGPGVNPRANGKYILFTDHGRVVGELRSNYAEQVAEAWAGTGEAQRQRDEFWNEANELRTALAASRAEVEGWKKDAERYRWLRLNCIWETTISDEIEKVIDEELESTNV